MRLSYVVWDEGVPPHIIVELLSPGTEKQDLGPFYRKSDQIETSAEDVGKGDNFSEEGPINGIQALNAEPDLSHRPPQKWQVYEEILKVPYYIVFSRYSNQLRFFQLVGDRYQEQTLDGENPRIWLANLQVGLGLWHGEYRGITRQWLRWFDRNGNWLLTEAEQALAEKKQAFDQLEAERQLRVRLLERLKQQGIEINLDEL